MGRTSSTMKIAASLFMALAVFAPTCLGQKPKVGECRFPTPVVVKTTEWAGPEDSKSELVIRYHCAPTNWKFDWALDMQGLLAMGGRIPMCKSVRYCIKCEMPLPKGGHMTMCECSGDDCHDN